MPSSRLEMLLDNPMPKTKKEECIARQTSTRQTSMKPHLMWERLPAKRDRHGEIRMDLPIPQIPRDPRDEHIHLLLPPPQPPREQRQTEPLEAVEDVDLVPAPELLHEGVFGPGVGGPHEHALLDVDEAGFFHPRHVPVAHVRAHGSAELARRFAEELAPAQEVGAEVRVVSGFDREAVVLDFEPAAWFEVSAGERDG